MDIHTFMFYLGLILLLTGELRAISQKYKECEPTQHERLQESWRLHTQNEYNAADDSNLQSGWYRVDGTAGIRMLEINDLPKGFIERDQKTFRPCGTPILPEFVRVGNTQAQIFRSSKFYVLSENHPTVEQGIIATTVVQCRYNATRQKPFFGPNVFPNPECVFNPAGGPILCSFMAECGFTSQIDVAVRNCVSIPECQNYVNNTDTSRLWNSVSRTVADIQNYCQDSQFSYQWTRFLYENTTNGIVVENCTTNSSVTGNPPCGAIYRGFLQGSHPTVEEGRVTRTICFTLPQLCKCSGSMRIDIINCGEFYIYKKPALQPLCFSRICTQKYMTEAAFTTTNTPTTDTPTQNNTAMMTNITSENNTTMYTTTQPINTTHMYNTTVKINITQTHEMNMSQSLNMTTTVTTTTTNNSSRSSTTPVTTIVTATASSRRNTSNLCQTYTTIVDDSRMFSYVRKNSKCDLFHRESVRFMSSTGSNLQLKEKCSAQDIASPRYFCGGLGITFVEESHPNVSDIPMQATLCIYTFFNPISFSFFPKAKCECHYKQNILVQNCSGFYVYRMEPVIHPELECPARYCTEGVGAAEPSTSTTPSATIETTTTTIKTPNQTTATYSMEGSLQILNPILNFQALKSSDLMDKNTADYQFLMEICADILNHGFSRVQNIRSRRITNLRFGSLIAVYVITSDQPLNATLLDGLISDALVDRSSIDVSIGDRSFSGQVNTQTQALRDINECLTRSPCDVNAECINRPSTFSFQCICNNNYQGNGFTCTPIVQDIISNKWTNGEIVTVSVLFAIAFVMLVLLSIAVFFFYKRSKNTYETKNFNENNYDQYLTCDKIDNPKFNSYIDVDPSPVSHRSFKQEMEEKKSCERSHVAVNENAE